MKLNKVEDQSWILSVQVIGFYLITIGMITIVVIDYLRDQSSDTFIADDSATV